MGGVSKAEDEKRACRRTSFLFCVVSLLTCLVQTVLAGQGEQDYAVGRGALHVVVGKSEQECPFTAWLWSGAAGQTRGFLLPERRDWPL